MKQNIVFLTTTLEDNPSNTEHFKYRLGVSTDTLIVVDAKNTLLQTLVPGIGNEGYICMFQTEDDFYDAMRDIKQRLLAGESGVDIIFPNGVMNV